MSPAGHILVDESLGRPSRSLQEPMPEQIDPSEVADAPGQGGLVDTYGRIGDVLRVSVTDRCNFRCTYCMPAEGLPWLPKSEVLTFEEITRLVRLFLFLGVRSLKLTGGEPTVRAELPKLVRMLREVDPDVDISMTTNGFLLDRLARPLAEAGLDRVTVSLDSLLRHRFQEMTRRDALDKVTDGIRAAEEAGLTPIKLNCVVIAGTNDGEVVPAITTQFSLIGVSPASSAARIPSVTLSKASRRVISWNRCRSSESSETVTRSSPASASGRASRSRRKPFVVIEMSTSGSTSRSMRTNVGSSARTVGSPPVSLSERTPRKRNSRTSLVISSNVRTSLLGSHGSPSAGMQ